MKMYKCFIANYNRYIVFIPDGKANAITRRLYKNNDGTYYFMYNNEKVNISENAVYW